MTHPKEAVELVARALAENSYTSIGCHIEWDNMSPEAQAIFTNAAIALLDQIAPHYREQAAQIADKQASLSVGNDYDNGWCRAAAIIAAAIRKGE
jgi:hypothetical protein